LSSTITNERPLVIGHKHVPTVSNVAFENQRVTELAPLTIRQVSA